MSATDNPAMADAGQPGQEGCTQPTPEVGDLAPAPAPDDAGTVWPDGSCAGSRFDQTWYLDQHPDVRRAIQDGTYVDACDQFQAVGRVNGEPGAPDVPVVDPEPTTPAVEPAAPADLTPVDPGPIAPDAPAGPAVDPAPITPDPQPTDTNRILPWLDDDPPCTGLNVTPLLVLVDPNATMFDLTLSQVCVSALALPTDGTLEATARLIGPNLDLGVYGTVTVVNGQITAVDVSGWGSYDAANLGIQGTLQLHGDLLGATTSLTMSGALRMNGAVVTGDVSATLHKIGNEFVFDASGAVNYWKGSLHVGGTFTTILSQTASVPPGTDPLNVIIGSLRIHGTASLGTIHGDVDVLLSREAPGGPGILDLAITDVVLGKKLTVERISLGNTATMPTTFALDVQLRVPKLIDKSQSVHAVGNLDVTTGNFDLALVGAFRSNPLLGFLFVLNTSADIHLSATNGQLKLHGEVTAGIVVPLAASGLGGSATLDASLDANTGAVTASLDFHAAGCLVACFLVSAGGQFHATATGNIDAGWVDVAADGSASGQALFGIIAQGSGWARMNAHFDFGGSHLQITGTAAYAVEANSWLGMTHNVDDWMDISFEGDNARIVNGQWRRKREKVINLRGDVWPVRRECGDRYTKHWIDFNGWDYQGHWGDCDANGNVQVATVNGRLVHDVDRSFSETAGDTPVIDQRVQFQRDGTVIGTAYTDANGNYSARVTAGGMASMTIDPMPTDMELGFGQYSTGVIVSAGQTATIPTVGLLAYDFGTATGLAFNDLNQDGVLDAGEPLLPGATVALTSTVGPDRSTTTDAIGRWTISGLKTGEFWYATYTPPAGYWFRDDPYAVGENTATFMAWPGAPREVPPFGVVDVDIPVPGEVLTGHVTHLQFSFPFPTLVPLADRFVELDDGHVARTDADGNFRMIGLSPGAHSWTVWTDWPTNVTGTVDIVVGGPNHIEVSG